MKKNLTFIILFSFLSLTAWAKDFISITAVGDIMMASTPPVFAPAEAWIKASDIRFGNLEGTLFSGPAQSDGKTPGPNRWLFQTPPEMVSVLKKAGFNVMSLANNHVRDFGQAGIQSTKNALREAQIQFSSKAGEVATFTVDEVEVVLLAVDFYKAPRSITEPANTYAEIRHLKEKNKIVIISAHVGGEGSGAEIIQQGTEIFLGENRGDSIAFARKAIDAGADVIIMHGPHVPRGLEIYKERLIAYSLGNFMTGQGISLEGNAKIAPLLRLEIDKTGRFSSGQIVSFIQKREPQRVELDSQRSALKMIKKLSLEQFPDSPLTFEDNGQIR